MPYLTKRQRNERVETIDTGSINGINVTSRRRRRPLCLDNSVSKRQAPHDNTRLHSLT